MGMCERKCSVVQRIEHTGAQPTSQRIRNVLLS